jgi:hypothetical protein
MLRIIEPVTRRLIGFSFLVLPSAERLLGSRSHFCCALCAYYCITRVPREGKSEPHNLSLAMREEQPKDSSVASTCLHGLMNRIFVRFPILGKVPRCKHLVLVIVTLGGNCLDYKRQQSSDARSRLLTRCRFKA